MAANSIDEEWRPIDGSPGYEVSNLGRVKSLDRTIERGGFPRKIKGKILSPYPNTKGYPLVDLSTKRRAKKVHILVCAAFNGPCPEGKTQVAHGNGHRTDNRPNNLRWATAQENADDSVRLDVMPKGEGHSKAKLKEADVIEIRNLKSDGVGIREIARRYGVRHTSVVNILNGKHWKHV